MSAEVTILNRGTEYFITVSGRATFDQAPQLRALSKALDTAKFTAIGVDLKNCLGMDSTFMGILAMLGLHARKNDAVMTVFNADELNRSLLFGLGLKKLFEYKAGTLESAGAQPWGTASAQPAASSGADAQTVLEAHKTLMSADEGNVKKFEKVVELVQKDIDSRNSGTEK